MINWAFSFFCAWLQYEICQSRHADGSFEKLPPTMEAHHADYRFSGD